MNLPSKIPPLTLNTVFRDLPDVEAHLRALHLARWERRLAEPGRPDLGTLEGQEQFRVAMTNAMLHHLATLPPPSDSEPDVSHKRKGAWTWARKAPEAELVPEFSVAVPEPGGGFGHRTTAPAP